MKAPFLATCGLMAATMAVHAETPVLTVLTYDSFVSDWGPGPAIKKAFEAECGCELRMIPGGDGAALLARLRLEGARSEADIVLGLDTNLTAAAEATELFAPHGIEATLELPTAWSNPQFLPYDWGWLAFMNDVKRNPNPPDSLRALADSDLKVVIQDPRSSTPGLGLVMWIEAAYGDKAGDLWRDLADNILTVTPGWSEAYDLFVKGEADMVLSYTTSAAYHMIAEDDATKQPAPFSDGHYLQIEVAGILKHSPQQELARKFMAFMVSDGFQAAIPETNWMYPAKTPAGGLHKAFDSLHRPEKSLLLDDKTAESIRDRAIETWRNALAR